MEVQLTPDQKAFVRQSIENGRLHAAEDAVREALSMWEEREITPMSIRELAQSVKQRERARLAAERNSPR